MPEVADSAVHNQTARAKQFRTLQGAGNARCRRRQRCPRLHVGTHAAAEAAVLRFRDFSVLDLCWRGVSFVGRVIVILPA
jgi:hypothetical protein